MQNKESSPIVGVYPVQTYEQFQVALGLNSSICHHNSHGLTIGELLYSLRLTEEDYPRVEGILAQFEADGFITKTKRRQKYRVTNDKKMERLLRETVEDYTQILRKYYYEVAPLEEQESRNACYLNALYELEMLESGEMELNSESIRSIESYLNDTIEYDSIFYGECRMPALNYFVNKAKARLARLLGNEETAKTYEEEACKGAELSQEQRDHQNSA